MKKSIFKVFRRFVKLFSGYRLRERYPPIDQLFQWLNRLLSPTRVTVFEHIMYLDSSDAMGLGVDGVYEPIETKLIHDIIKPGDVVVDVGANIGYYTLLYARIVSSTGKVYAFEPQSRSFQLLKKNVRVNGYSNVEVLNMAISNFVGEISLFMDRFSNLDHRIFQPQEKSFSEVVKTVTLDIFFDGMEQELSFVKMDIQGAEGLALEGMTRILQENRAIKLLTEFWPYGLEMAGTDPGDFLVKLENSGFRLFDIKRGSSIQTPVSVPEILNEYTPDRRNHTNLFCIF